MKKHFLCKSLLALLAVLPGTTAALADDGHYAEDYQFITGNGAWCWFSDPRAIYAGNNIVGGYVDNAGSIWSFSYNPQTQESTTRLLHEKLDYDDHANPSVMQLNDGRIAIFYSAHGGTTNSPMYYRISQRPGDTSAWGEEASILPDSKGGFGICYSNPVQLSEENNRTYLFYRGSDFKPNFVVSDDLKTWSKGYTLVKNDSAYGSYGRPYTKITTNHKDKIFFAFTDGHPRDRATNSIYFMMYKDGKLCKASGEVISPDIYTPVAPSQTDKVYDASKTFNKAWIWDIAYDKDERPVIVYARFNHSDSRHSYWYARWNGKAWENHRITDACQYFMRSPKHADKNYVEHEENYSGGVILDHEDPTIVYTSRPVNNVFEIEKWQFNPSTKKWTTTAVTRNSSRDNIRPFVIRNHRPGQPAVLWMYNYEYPGFRAYNSAIRIDQVAKGFDAALTRENILKVGARVADWQVRAYQQRRPASNVIRDWRNGVLFNGMFDWAEYYEKETSDPKYFQFIQKMFNAEYWAPGNRLYHADDICVCQCYLDMYNKYGRKNYLKPTLARVEWVLENQPTGNIDNSKGPSDRWWWCDALYMAPAVYTRLYAITGEKKYLKFFDQEFKACYRQLYDPEECLFFRDSNYLGKKEKNGKKVFWGRGNGWVMGGLAEILKTLPADEKKYRKFYEDLFREMAQRIIRYQDADGYWHASLLDMDSYPEPETSSTGLITYALAYGINAGLLDEATYKPVVLKGWNALVKAVDTEGKVCWVQPVGQDPRKISKKSTEVYGVGGFLMTAVEMSKMIK